MSEALDARTEAGIAVLSVLVFIGILLAAGVVSKDAFGATGAYAVVAGMVVFILVMAGVGYWISTKHDEDSE